MRILGISIEGFQKIKVFNLEPKGNVIKITGGNAAGKSSVLDAIMLTLQGVRGGPAKPVRMGDGSAVVQIDFGEYRVTRKWIEGGDTKGEMYLEAVDGRRYGTPQAVLDGFMGKISFDPLAFLRMDRKNQAAELRKLLDLDDVLDEIHTNEQSDYNTRREQKKQLEALQAQRAAILIPQDLPKKKRDLDAMTQELAEVADFNMSIERERLRRDGILVQIARMNQASIHRQTKIEELKKQLLALETEMQEEQDAQANIEEEYGKLPPLAEPKDAAQLSEQITAARAVNLAIDRRDKAEHMDAEIATIAKTVDKLSEAIEGHREKAISIIANAHYPVKGLGFAEDEVLYNGLPFTQASNAEQIKVSIAMGMAGDPKLRVMRIKDGSLLDDDSMKVVEEMAAEHDFQLWVEMVDTSGKIGVYLVDGEIEAIDGEKRPPLKLKKSLATVRRKPVQKETV